MSDTAQYRAEAAAALTGCQVQRVAFDFQTRLSLVGSSADGSKKVSATLIIATQFELRNKNGTTHKLDPSTSGTALAPVIELFMTTLHRVNIEESGALTLSFDDGAQLSVQPHARYEAWDLVGNGVPKIVVAPGGGIAVWTH